jgi:hypothetical protein
MTAMRMGLHSGKPESPEDRIEQHNQDEDASQGGPGD